MLCVSSLLFSARRKKGFEKKKEESVPYLVPSCAFLFLSFPEPSLRSNSPRTSSGVIPAILCSFCEGASFFFVSIFTTVFFWISSSEIEKGFDPEGHDRTYLGSANIVLFLVWKAFFVTLSRIVFLLPFPFPFLPVSPLISASTRGPKWSCCEGDSGKALPSRGRLEVAFVHFLLVWFLPFLFFIWFVKKKFSVSSLERGRRGKMKGLFPLPMETLCLTQTS